MTRVDFHAVTRLSWPTNQRKLWTVPPIEWRYHYQSLLPNLIELSWTTSVQHWKPVTYTWSLAELHLIPRSWLQPHSVSQSLSPSSVKLIYFLPISIEPERWCVPHVGGGGRTFLHISIDKQRIAVLVAQLKEGRHHFAAGMTPVNGGSTEGISLSQDTRSNQRYKTIFRQLKKTSPAHQISSRIDTHICLLAVVTSTEPFDLVLRLRRHPRLYLARCNKQWW